MCLHYSGFTCVPVLCSFRQKLPLFPPCFPHLFPRKQLRWVGAVSDSLIPTLELFSPR